VESAPFFIHSVVNLILFTVLLVHLILRISYHLIRLTSAGASGHKRVPEGFSAEIVTLI